VRNRCALLSLLVILLAPLGLRAEDRAHSLIIMPLKAQRLDPETVSILDTLLADAVARAVQLKAITPSDINAMLGLEKMRDVASCDTVSCAAELGGALGANYVMFGSASVLGGQMILSLSLIDDAAQKLVARQQERVQAKEEQYAAAVERATQGLFRQARTLVEAGLVTDPQAWKALGLDEATWGRYRAYASAARQAGVAVVDVKTWQQDPVASSPSYVEYLESRGDAAAAGQPPESFEAWRQRHTGSVVITSQPPGARVRVAGVDRGTAPITVEGAPGLVQVTLTLNGYRPEERAVRLEAGAAERLEIALESLEAIAAREREAAQRVERMRQRELSTMQVAEHASSSWFWGGATAVTGALAGFLFLRGPSREDLRESYDAFLQANTSGAAETAYESLEDSTDSHNRNRLLGGVCAGASALSAIFFVYNLKAYLDDVEALGPEGVPTVAPLPGQGALGLSLRWAL
jgi:hypothetical protein